MGSSSRPWIDGASNHEDGDCKEAVGIAKRGRQCALGTGLVGRNTARGDHRNFERNAAHHGVTDEDAPRLKEYPSAMQRCQEVMRRLRAHTIRGRRCDRK